MRIEQDHIIFDYPGGQISFHKDLKKYFEIRQRVLAPEADLVGDIEKINTADDAKKTTNSIGLKLIHVISQEILPTLAGYGVYNLTIDDFLEKNPGFTQLVDATGELLGYSSSLNNEFQTWARNEKEKAEIQAKQSITGPGYGIISSDWVAHAIYAAKSASVVKKQAAAAQAQYNQNAWAIDNATSQVAYSEVKKLIQSTFKPIALNYLSMAFEFVLSKYVEYLEQAGVFASNCLDRIDEARSTTILDNLDYIEQKDPVIYQAIQLCPYNLNIYSAMCDQKILFQQIHKDILAYFGLLDGFCEYIKESCVHTGGTMSEAYSLNQYRIQQLSFLKQVEVKDTARLCLLPDFNRLLDLYAQIALTIRGGQTLFELSRIRYPIAFDLSKANSFNDTAVNCKELFCNELEKERQSFTPDEINFCETQCNIGVFSSLSLWFKFEIHSFDELNTFIMSKWDEGVRIDENKKQTREIIEEISVQKEKVQKLTKQIDATGEGRGILLFIGLFCMSPIFFFMYNGVGLDVFFSVMTAGLIEFIVSIACLFSVGVGIWILFRVIDDILFGKKRLQEQLEEETQKLLSMEKKKETITSQEIK